MKARSDIFASPSLPNAVVGGVGGTVIFDSPDHVQKSVINLYKH